MAQTHITVRTSKKNSALRVFVRMFHRVGKPLVYIETNYVGEHVCLDAECNNEYQSFFYVVCLHSIQAVIDQIPSQHGAPFIHVSRTPQIAVR